MTNTNTATNETMTDTASRYVAKWNKYNQCVVVLAATAHMPHADVRWYDGGCWMSTTVAMLEDETLEACAQRIGGNRVSASRRETLTASLEELRATR